MLAGFPSYNPSPSKTSTGHSKTSKLDIIKATEALSAFGCQEFPFLFPFLQNLLTFPPEVDSSGVDVTERNAQQIFNEIIKILDKLQMQIRMAPDSIEYVSVQGLSLLFMLKQVSVFCQQRLT